MHFLSYQLPPASELKLGLKKTRAGQQRSSVKRQRKCIFSGFLQLYCSKSKCASQCQVLGKSVDWFITNCKWDGRQFLHYGYAIVEETHSVQRAIATGKDIFLQKYHAHKAANHWTACLVYQKSANLLKCDVLGVQTLTLKYVWPMCVIVARGHWSVLLACDNDRWNTPTNALGATSHITSHNPLCYGDWPLDTFRCKQLLWCTKAPQFDVLAKMVIWK